MEFHEIGNLRVSFDLSGGFHGLPPGGLVSWGSPLSSFPRVSSVFRRVASLFVADEAFSVSDVLRSFARREIDFVYIHSIGIWSRGSASRQDVAVSPSSEFPKSYHVSVEFPSFIKPLFPLPTSLSIREGGSSHHDSELVGYPSLEGIHQDAVIVDPTACLGQLEGSGVFIKVLFELVHAERIDSLAGSVFKIFWYKGFFKSFAQLFKGLFRVGNPGVGQLHIPSFGEGGPSSFA